MPPPAAAAVAAALSPFDALAPLRQLGRAQLLAMSKAELADAFLQMLAICDQVAARCHPKPGVPPAAAASPAATTRAAAPADAQPPADQPTPVSAVEPKKRVARSAAAAAGAKKQKKARCLAPPPASAAPPAAGAEDLTQQPAAAAGHHDAAGVANAAAPAPAVGEGGAVGWALPGHAALMEMVAGLLAAQPGIGAKKAFAAVKVKHPSGPRPLTAAARRARPI